MRTEHTDRDKGIPHSGCLWYEFSIVIQRNFREMWHDMGLSARESPTEISAEGTLVFDGEHPACGANIELDQYIPNCLGIAFIHKVTRELDGTVPL